jgi:hypothetical protein
VSISNEMEQVAFKVQARLHEWLSEPVIFVFKSCIKCIEDDMALWETSRGRKGEESV